MTKIVELIQFIAEYDGISSKDFLKREVTKKFQLIRDRSVFYCNAFAIRFSYSKTDSFSNTVLSLSNLKKYDDLPFLVCLITPKINKLYLANTTFLSKISHSSQQLTEKNIRGSFNGSDIIKCFEGIENCRDNIEELYAFHQEISFEDNLPRLVEATNRIAATGQRFLVDDDRYKVLLQSVDRAIAFNTSNNSKTLKQELDIKVNKYRNEIICVSHVENVNIRGRLIEYLVTEEENEMKTKLVESIKKEYKMLPKITSKNLLGDYHQTFGRTVTETDIKTKIVVLKSNPKAYNIDKFLDFLSQPHSVFLFYFIGVDTVKVTNTALVSVFQKELLEGTMCHNHWAGRNSRGVTQFKGTTIDNILSKTSHNIDKNLAIDFLNEMINK